jgi:hypothetical protein
MWLPPHAQWPLLRRVQWLLSPLPLSQRVQLQWSPLPLSLMWRLPPQWRPQGQLGWWQQPLWLLLLLLSLLSQVGRPWSMSAQKNMFSPTYLT